MKTGLEEIAGIGPATAQKLLTRFGSVKGIREATTEDVIAEIGAKKAEVVLRGLAAVPLENNTTP